MLEITFTIQDPRIYETSGPPEIGTLICRESKAIYHYHFEQTWPYEFAHIVKETTDRYIIQTLFEKSTRKIHKHVIGRKKNWGFVTQQVINDMTQFYNSYIRNTITEKGFKIVNKQEQS